MESELDERGDTEEQLKQRITSLERRLNERESEKERDETEEELVVVSSTSPRRLPEVSTTSQSQAATRKTDSPYTLEEELTSEDVRSSVL